MRFGDILKKTRNDIGLNQVELANKLGISKQIVSKYERNEVLPSVSTLNDIATALGCSTDYLLGRVPNKDMALLEGEYNGERVKIIMDLKDKEEIIKNNEAKIKELEQACLELVLENRKLKNN